MREDGNLMRDTTTVEKCCWEDEVLMCDGDKEAKDGTRKIKITLERKENRRAGCIYQRQNVGKRGGSLENKE